MTIKAASKKTKAAPVVETVPAPEVIVAFKGFDKDLSCRGFKYELGKTFKSSASTIVRCGEGGFHSCENPFDVWGYYPMSTSRYAIVEVGGKIVRAEGEDSKIASAEITIKAELTIPEFIKRGVAAILALAKGNTATGDSGHAAATGYRGHAAATGDSGHAAATGKNSIATACGYVARAKAGVGGAIMLACISDKDYATILAVRASKVGENGVEPNVFYSLNSKGEFVKEESQS